MTITSSVADAVADAVVGAAPAGPADGAALRVVVVNGSPSERSKTMGVVDAVFDLIDQYALANKLVLLVATGGTERHALALEHALRPLFAFFQALTVPVAIFASAADFDGTRLLNPRVYGRIEMSLRDVADLLKTRATGVHPTSTPTPGSR